MEFLVIGGSGQVGTELRDQAFVNGVRVVAPGRSDLDLSSEMQVAQWVKSQHWDAIINAAAYTQVDAAENDKTAAWEINARAPGHLAAASARQGIPIIHVSTDYVFDGGKGAPYFEADAVAPLNVYGSSKEAGERAVRAMNPRHVILRTSWVYSSVGRNFVKTMLRLAHERDRLAVVADQKGCPTSASEVARACFELARRIASRPQHASFGTYHFSGAGEATWFEFAKAIFDIAGGGVGRIPEVVPIDTAQYPTPAQRPMDSRLDCRAIANVWGITPRPWKLSLRHVLDQLLSAGDVDETVVDRRTDFPKQAQGIRL